MVAWWWVKGEAVQLQKLADATGLVIHVHHYPPGRLSFPQLRECRVSGLLTPR